MTKEKFKELLGNGFNVENLATEIQKQNEGLRPSGRIRELIHQPVEGQVYHYNDINTNAIYDLYKEKYGIDFDQIDYDFVLAKKSTSTKSLQIGDKTARGIVEQIAKVAGCYVYMIRDEKTNQMVMLKKSEI